LKLEIPKPPSIREVLEGRLAGIVIWCGVPLVLYGFATPPWSATNRSLMLGWAMVLGGLAGDQLTNLRGQQPTRYAYKQVTNWSTVGYVIALGTTAVAFGFAAWTGANPIVGLARRTSAVEPMILRCEPFDSGLAPHVYRLNMAARTATDSQPGAPDFTGQLESTDSSLVLTFDTSSDTGVPSSFKTMTVDRFTGDAKLDIAIGTRQVLSAARFRCDPSTSRKF
jgi:hypothetical protein